MINQDFDKFIKYQEKAKANEPGRAGKHAKNLDPATNNRKTSNSHPGAEGRER
ncbi:hypothetical protein ACFOGI_08845 [Virgibacillus xinjiangensis]|uniref:DUF4023 domain-containing protein n=1 Tax=Virgibacillus xinjiangensis TaxID=393090 RepID=A0ABV7CVN9_9BACI